MPRTIDLTYFDDESVNTVRERRLQAERARNASIRINVPEQPATVTSSSNTYNRIIQNQEQFYSQSWVNEAINFSRGSGGGSSGNAQEVLRTGDTTRDESGNYSVYTIPPSSALPSEFIPYSPHLARELPAGVYGGGMVSIPVGAPRESTEEDDDEDFDIFDRPLPNEQRIRESLETVRVTSEPVSTDSEILEEVNDMPKREYYKVEGNTLTILNSVSKSLPPITSFNMGTATALKNAVAKLDDWIARGIYRSHISNWNKNTGFRTANTIFKGYSVQDLELSEKHLLNLLKSLTDVIHSKKYDMSNKLTALNGLKNSFSMTFNESGTYSIHMETIQAQIRYVSGLAYDINKCETYRKLLNDLIAGKIKSFYSLYNNNIHQHLKNSVNAQNTNKKGLNKDIHYKLVSKKNDYDDDVIQTLISLNYNTNRNITLIKIKKKVILPVATANKVIDLHTFYPAYDIHIDSLMRSFNEYFKRGTGREAQLTKSGAHEISTEFNRIKFQLMLLGFSEVGAVDRILTDGFRNSERNMHSQYKATYDYGIMKCYSTGQSYPDFLMHKAKLITGEYVYICSYAVYKVRSWYEFTVNTDVDGNCVYFQNQMDKDKSYAPGRDIFGYSCKNIEGLSPRALPEELRIVYDANRVYTPIPFMGVELEVERNDNCPIGITDDVLNDLGRDFVILKRDGSLTGEYPFEIVTVPATLQYHKMAWEPFMNNTAVKSKLKSYKSGSCGMHVHVSRDSFTGLHLAKFRNFINLESNREFLAKLAGRGSNGYNEYANNEKLSQAADTAMYGRSGHTSAVNVSNQHTIEVRIFRGNLAKSHFYKNLEFVHALWTYTKNCSMQQLDYKDFVTWLFKDNCSLYNNLQEWLAASGILVSNRNTSKVKELSAKELKKLRLVIDRKYNTKKDSDTLRRSSKDKHVTKEQLLANQ